MPLVDIVVVAYNSSPFLRGCVEPLVRDPDLYVVVVDNASSDGGLSTVADLRAKLIAAPRNLGFSGGCNVGWRNGKAPFVMFLNPDATIDPGGVRRLVDEFKDEGVGVVAPKILDRDGKIEHSQHRFPTLTSTLLHAVFLDRLAGRPGWGQDDVTDPEVYERLGSPDWVGGACVVFRRETLDRLDGFDERFFMYAEDMDICWRLRKLGLQVRYLPEVEVRHQGGASAPAPRRNALQMQSRVLYAHKHYPMPVLSLFTGAFLVGLLVRLVLDPANGSVHIQGLRGVLRGLRNVVQG